MPVVTHILRFVAVVSMAMPAAWAFSHKAKPEASEAELSAAFPAVVGLEMLDEKNVVKGLCTGSIIREDLIVTAAHCFAENSASKVRVWDRYSDPLQQKNLLSLDRIVFPTYSYAPDSTDSIRQGYATDIAVAVFAKKSFAPAQIGHLAAHEPKYDELVTVIGYGTEWSYDHTHATRMLLTWTNKIVTTFDQLANAILISTTKAGDAAVALSAGQSGGPLLSSQREIYGIAHDLSTRAVLNPAQPTNQAALDANTTFVSASYVNVNDRGIAAFLHEVMATEHPTAHTGQDIQATPIASRQ